MGAYSVAGKGIKAKTGKKPIIKTSAKGVLGDPILFKPTLLG